MTSERDVRLPDGRTLRVCDSGSGDTMTILWHTGSPQSGVLLDPLLAAATSRDIRLVSYGRPGYGASTPNVGRTVGSAAGDVAHIADALGLERFAVMGASGGGPHSLACAALLPERVSGVATLAGIAPRTDEFDWTAGMVSPGGLLAAMRGREARVAFAEVDEFDPAQFVAADWAALEGDWASLGADAGATGQSSPGGLIDDDLAFVTDWGFSVADIRVPVLVVQGGADRVVPAAHGEWLSGRIPGADLWRRTDDGHISVLAAAPEAMDWLLEHTS